MSKIKQNVNSSSISTPAFNRKSQSIYKNATVSLLQIKSSKRLYKTRFHNKQCYYITYIHDLLGPTDIMQKQGEAF